MEEEKKSLRERLGPKKLQYIAVFVIAAAILAIYFSSFFSFGGEQTAEKKDAEIKDDLEARISRTLSKVENAGEVSVVITYESSGELIPGFSTNTSSTENGESTNKSTQSSPITVQSSGTTSALIVEEKEPEIKGVLVVAEGADNIKVKMDLLNAVTTLFNIPVDKVEILKMQN